MESKYSAPLDSVEYGAPAGCTYTLSTKTVDELLFSNKQMEFTSNFKEKAAKNAVYKVKVEQRMYADDASAAADDSDLDDDFDDGRRQLEAD